VLFAARALALPQAPPAGGMLRTLDSSGRTGSA
jgi:hypothetical protein